MLPAFRFMLGAALATLLLSLTVFGLAATLRLAQETKLSRPEPARALAYASPTGWKEFNEPDAARQIEAGVNADAAIVPLREDIAPAESPKSAANPDQRAEAVEPEQEPSESISPRQDQFRSSPPQEEWVEAIPSTARPGDEQETVGDTKTEAAEIKSSEPVEAPIEPNPRAESRANGNVAGLEQPVTAPATKRHPAPAQKTAPKPKPAERLAKTKKTTKRAAAPARNTLLPGTGSAAPLPWIGEVRDARGRPATKLATQPCGPGSFTCSPLPLGPSGARQSNFQMPLMSARVSHPQ
jgi:hypothetical protein